MKINLERFLKKIPKRLEDRKVFFFFHFRTQLLSKKVNKLFFPSFDEFLDTFRCSFITPTVQINDYSLQNGFPDNRNLWLNSTLAEIESLHTITECAYRDWLYPAHRHCLSLLPWGLSTRDIGFLGIHPRFCHAKNPNTYH